MPLSEQEQRLLEEMERGLYSNDADFVASVGGVRLRPSYRSIVIGVLTAVVGIGILVAGVALSQLWLGVLGFVVMFGGVLLTITPSKSSRRLGATSTSGQGKSRGPVGARGAGRSDQGFMDRLNERWDRRQDGRP